MTKREMVFAFIDRINAHDVDGMYALMDKEHIFIDGIGRSIKGREAIRQAWQSYFAMIPDYWIKLERLFEDEAGLAIFGKAGGTVVNEGRLDAQNRWEIPAAWHVVVGENAIILWQVFADTEPVRQIMTRTPPTMKPQGQS